MMQYLLRPFRWLWPSSPPDERTPQTNAMKTYDVVQSILSSEELVEKRERFLENEVAKLEASIKALAATKDPRDKTKALQLLKLKKMKETALKQASDARLNMSLTRQTLEHQTITSEVAGQMQAAAASLRAEHTRLPIEAVEDTLEQVRDAMATQHEVAELLGQPVTSVDDDDVLKELEDLEEECRREQA
eukprot:Sspe_Gene.118145::Locus_110945_Transcript_1_1_Confidence_1.000_Length_614::g.118145::m.118145/K12194/CHMP4, SNF7, VPS32; charged multivesicular body protein 4